MPVGLYLIEYQDILPIITVEKETNLSVDKERGLETEVGIS